MLKFRQKSLKNGLEISWRKQNAVFAVAQNRLLSAAIFSMNYTENLAKPTEK